MSIKPILLAAAILLGGNAHAAMSFHNTDEVLPNPPWKEHGIPDPGRFNPAGGLEREIVVLEPVIVAPAAMTYYPPAIVIDRRVRKPYALVAAPTLPCAPGYCPRRVRVDRN